MCKTPLTFGRGNPGTKPCRPANKLPRKRTLEPRIAVMISLIVAAAAARGPHQLQSRTVPATLTALGRKYGTDKVSHRFTQVYERVFGVERLSVQRLLEVGVWHGASVRMWRDWCENAQVVGVDLFKPAPGHSHYRSTNEATKFYHYWQIGRAGDRLQLLAANQSSRTELGRLVSKLRKKHGEFDLVIDDGSHLQRDQQLALGYLLPLVRPGGAFVIEDIHTGVEDGYDEPPYGPDTTIAVLRAFNSTNRLRSKHLTRDQATYVEQMVASIDCSRLWWSRARDGQKAHQTCIVRKSTQAVDRFGASLGFSVAGGARHPLLRELPFDGREHA